MKQPWVCLKGGVFHWLWGDILSLLALDGSLSFVAALLLGISLGESAKFGRLFLGFSCLCFQLLALRRWPWPRMSA